METEIAQTSQPETETEVVTSTQEPEIDSVTSNDEPTENKVAAEGQQEEQSKKYAGKYTTIEDLEKGYGSQASYINKLQSEINEYKSKIEQQQQEQEKAKLNDAKAKGFETVEAQEIEQKTILKEFELYANNIDKVAPEYMQTAATALRNYYATANAAYLKEAKQYFSQDFVESAAIQKKIYEQELQAELKQKEVQNKDNARKELCNQIETEYKDFVSDVVQGQNDAKATVIRTMMDAGVIQSLDDMKVFVNLYNSIAERAVSDYLAAQKAQNDVNSIKQKATVPTGNGEGSNDAKKLDINTKEYWEKRYS